MIQRSELRKRVQRLETRLRVQSFILAVVTLFAIGFMTIGTMRIGAVEKIEARNFVLVDETGKPRGFWSVNEASDAVFSLCNSAGDPRLALAVDKKQAPQLMMIDNHGRPRISATVVTDKAADITVSGVGKGVDVSLTSSVASALTSRLADGSSLTVGSLDSKDLLLSFQLPGPKASMVLRSRADGSPSLTLMNEGKVCVDLRPDDAGVGRMRLIDTRTNKVFVVP